MSDPFDDFDKIKHEIYMYKININIYHEENFKSFSSKYPNI